MKHALVTGAGARLGRAMALYLGDRGYDVAVHYNSSSDGADEVVSELKAKGRQAVALQADLLDETATHDLLPRAAGALGGRRFLNTTTFLPRQRKAGTAISAATCGHLSF